MLGLPFDTWIRFAVWLVIGLLVYAFYGAKHSRIEQSAARVSNTLAQRRVEDSIGNGDIFR